LIQPALGDAVQGRCCPMRDEAHPQPLVGFFPRGRRFRNSPTPFRGRVAKIGSKLAQLLSPPVPPGHCTRNNNRMRLTCAILLGLALFPTATRGQDEFKIEALKESPPDALAAPVKTALSADGYRVVNGQGKPVVDFWLRKAIPASGRPSGPKGAVSFPVLAEGELLGALRFPSDGHDYRDQPIATGVYTIRYGLQPINGDHLGVSPYRDFALLVAAKKDSSVDAVPRKKLEEQSAEAAGTSHPAVLMLLPPPDDAKAASMVHDDAKDTWGAVVPLALAVKGETAPSSLVVQLVVAGVAAN
jgi:hypothetical protein